jgi:predicted GNAT superfamily acetyltransferase
MSLDPKFKVSEFPSHISSEFLKEIYNLNQEHTPEVGSLSSIEYLQELIKLSSNNFYISFKNKIIGFMICFREESEYKSKNYKFFTKNKSKFLYIDRIAVKSDYRRNGIGRSLYALISSIAIDKEIPLCCEVNIQPLNQISIDFHENLGFCRVGEFAFDDHAVAYFIKEHS